MPRERRRVSRRPTAAAWLATALGALGTVAAAALVGGKGYVVASVLMVLWCMVPFFASFEQRRPSARELVVIAVMAALAVASRAAFLWVPHFKPMAAVVMVAGIGLGASSGFMVGSLAALVSNFIFGQGPWTPWQMLAFGLCGFAFGALADRDVVPRSHWTARQRVAVALGGGAFVVLVAGPVLDTSSVFLMLSRLTPEGVAAVYLAGLPVNALHGTATAATLLLAGSPLLGKLDRVRRKHGVGAGLPPTPTPSLRYDGQMSRGAPHEEGGALEIAIAQPAHLDALVALAERAQAAMADLGIDQWQSGYPNRTTWEADVAAGRAYVALDEEGVAGVLCYCPGPEAAYEALDGAWVAEGPYAALHRCAVDPRRRGRGIVGQLFAFACAKAVEDGMASVRIDTHADNAPMRRAVEKAGFAPCGTITLTEGPEAGTTRLAFEKPLAS